MDVTDGGLNARLDWLSGELKSAGNKHRYTAPIDEAIAEADRRVPPLQALRLRPEHLRRSRAEEHPIETRAIVAALAEAGYAIAPDLAAEVWARYSREYWCAGWSGLPHDGEIRRVVLEYCELEPEARP